VIGIPERLVSTEAQQRIVDWDEGPLVVIAGAGTGKTRVIVERLAHERVAQLLRTKGATEGIPPEPASDHDPLSGPLLREQILEGRLTLRLQAVELLSLLKGTAATETETPAARTALSDQLDAVASAVAAGSYSARARTSVVRIEGVMPYAQQPFSIHDNDAPDPVQLASSVALGVSDAHRLEPERGRSIHRSDVDMWRLERLAILMCAEPESVRAEPENRRHADLASVGEDGQHSGPAFTLSQSMITPRCAEGTWR
jgi:hypothetical protein